jgi:hypothetical protein
VIDRIRRRRAPEHGALTSNGLAKDGRVLNYFSMVTTVGTPQTVAAQELRIECMFPADEATEVFHVELLDGEPTSTTRA